MNPRSTITLSRLAGGCVLAGSLIGPVTHAADGMPAASTATATASVADACSLLTAAEVSAVLKVPVEAGRRPVADDASTCNWRESGKPEGPARNVMLIVIDAKRFDIEKSPGANRGAQPTIESGVGDEAYFHKALRFPPNLNVRAGNVYLHLMARTQMPRPGEREYVTTDADRNADLELARTILEKLHR